MIDETLVDRTICKASSAMRDARLGAADDAAAQIRERAAEGWVAQTVNYRQDLNAGGRWGWFAEIHYTRRRTFFEITGEPLS